MTKITFSQLFVYIDREPLTIKYVTVSVSFFHFVPFVRTLHATRPIRSFSAGKDILRLYRHNLQNKNGRPGSFCLSVKIVFATISPSAQRPKVVQRDVQEG